MDRTQDTDSTQQNLITVDLGERRLAKSIKITIDARQLREHALSSNEKWLLGMSRYPIQQKFKENQLINCEEYTLIAKQWRYERI